ncbi:MAG: mannose-1-phosphate guanylyltransferase, partial [Muribaculaceae bacterium]|nr:mannose-1-phosphate guanylyltransferase [Muribaculaceae bacterium]MBJ2196569.1 mannose-1-phosphate guanylyltransferase [Muribaculaceae bacterium]
MNPHRYCVVMCGGVGTRFWPFSRSSMPKQFLDFFGT